MICASEEESNCHIGNNTNAFRKEMAMRRLGAHHIKDIAGDLTIGIGQAVEGIVQSILLDLRQYRYYLQ